MKRILITSTGVLMIFLALAQNKEIRHGKDITQPGQINPALAGLQEDMFRLLTNTDLNDISFLIEGKIPFKLGNYMIGYDRTANEYVSESVFNLTYGRTSKKEKGREWTFRYGGSLEFSGRSSLSSDSSNGVFSIVDLNGETTTFGLPTDLKDKINYVNLSFGGSMQFKKLILSLAVSNISNPAVSMIEGEKRNLPLSADIMLGGFVKLGENITLFPSAIATFNNENYFVRTAVNMNTKYFNLNAAYLSDDIRQDISASLGFHYKKSFFGLKFDQPLGSSAQDPIFQIFLNSGIFKDRKMFKSDFAKQIGLFY